MLGTWGTLPGDQDAMTLRKGTLLLADLFLDALKFYPCLKSPMSPKSTRTEPGPAMHFAPLVNVVHFVNFI